MGNIVGIDLGTSTTLVACFNEAGTAQLTPNHDGDTVTPSVVQIEPNGEIIIGKEAKKLLGLGFAGVFAEFKRDLGQGLIHKFGSQDITPEQLTASLLKQVLHDYASQFGQPEMIVVSWPANFTDAQRSATKEAVRMANLKIDHYVSEPTAAALYYAFNEKLNGMHLVYDIGGGTFDVSLISADGNEIQVKFSEGVQRLGGADMDQELLKIIDAKYRQKTGHLFDRVDCSFTQLELEAAKHSLSTRDSTQVRLVSETHGPQMISVTRQEFEDAVKPLLRKAEEACAEMLRNNGTDKSAVGKVFMVGGPSRMPCVQESVRAFFNKAPTVKEPGDAVAKGAAIFAALRAPKTLLGPLQAKAVGQTSVVDITPHYFGIAIHEQYSTSSHYNRVLIDKGLPVPHSIVKRFITSPGENRTGIQLIITQSQRSERDISKVKILHNKAVPINPRGEAGEPIEVTFSYDANGMMECILHEISTGKKTQLNLQAG